MERQSIFFRHPWVTVTIVLLGLVVVKYSLGGKKTSTWICEANYSTCQLSPDSTYWMVYDGKAYGYVDLEGRILIPPSYEEITPFDSGQFALAKKENKYGWINWQGNEIIPFIFDRAQQFVGEKAQVEKDGRSYHINRNAQEIENLKAEEIILKKPAGNPTSQSTLQKNSSINNIETILADGEQKIPEVPIPQVISVPGGAFWMGCTADQGDDCGSDEKPKHQVNLKSFFIGKYEVTFDEYDFFCLATGRKKPDDEGWGRGRRPVINVSWVDAIAYCQWLSKETGKSFRLPSEAEWEFAARGGENGRVTMYSGSNYLDSVGWYKSNSMGKTHPVEEKAPNELGVFDMSGNVWEWTQDCWRDNYGDDTPIDGSAWNVGDCSLIVMRGGSLGDHAWHCRVANRISCNANLRLGFNGFRVAHD
jgi:formylglycine-generating enzyme required for sulfatase activity